MAINKYLFTAFPFQFSFVLLRLTINPINPALSVPAAGLSEPLPGDHPAGGIPLS
jgi:hypothetical protein